MSVLVYQVLRFVHRCMAYEIVILIDCVGSASRSVRRCCDLSVPILEEAPACAWSLELPTAIEAYSL